MPKIKQTFLALLVILLVYTRFADIGWGLPYPFHPDERNMVIALQTLQCDLRSLKDCMNPHFFAYGQLPIYAAFLIIKLFHLISREVNSQVSFEEAVMVLRLISASFSVFTVYIGFKIAELLRGKLDFMMRSIVLLIFTFSPGLIQFAHFGTTESLLIFLYTTLVYVSLLFLKGVFPAPKFLLLGAFLSGSSAAVKISSLIFIGIPLLAVLLKKNPYSKKAIFSLRFILLSLAFGILLSPYNLIAFGEFRHSLNYESSVAMGLPVFYTRSFLYSAPLVFQLTKIFPYALGIPVLLFFIFGMLLLPFRKEENFLRLAFFIYFLPTAFLFAKWTRFMAPVFPIMLIFATVVILNPDWIGGALFQHLRSRTKFGMTLAGVFLIFALIIPGIAYLPIYQNKDVRVGASDWIYKNIPENSYILSETGNVVDVPIQQTDYKIVSFDFYHLGEDTGLKNKLEEHLKKADYIFVPSRRIFANHTCVKPAQSLKFKTQSYESKCKKLKQEYPELNDYYERLFSGKLGFRQVAEFDSYPRINLFGRILVEFKDEEAEETWSVFDHSVIRIYKKI